MLYAFDIDGTLIVSFMRDEPCDRCGGKRRVLAATLADGVASLTSDYVSCPDCVTRYDTVELLPGRAGALFDLAQQDGSCFALVTNQAGVAFDYQTPEQVGRKLGAVAAACGFFYSRPFSVHVAMGHLYATVDPAWRDPEQVARRKPSPTMLYEAMKAHRHGMHDTIYVGDRDTDRECALAAGIDYRDASEFFR